MYLLLNKYKVSEGNFFHLDNAPKQKILGGKFIPEKTRMCCEPFEILRIKPCDVFIFLWYSVFHCESEWILRTTAFAILS